jgi:triacylglycerol esterase/lipase EstA (alpha/beta hydrolase family)
MMSLPSRRTRTAAAAALTVTVLAGAGATAATSSARASALPVNWVFDTGFAAGFIAPATPPPGANNFGCKPGSAHPYPVILVHGTFENMDDNWQAAAPLLVNHGYCVFAFNYGGATASGSVQGTGDIPTSAQQLAAFVDQVLAATGAPKVDIVGHSQGGMMPRYYIDFLGGAATVHTLVGLAPSNYGTSVAGVTALTGALGLAAPAGTVLDTTCTACTQQLVGSSFLTKLNATPTVAGVNYTVIESKDDEVVTPYKDAFLPAASNVTNITLQNQCLLDQSDHLEIAYDPVALADVLNALDPANPVHVPCMVVLPTAGPVGVVPSF